MSRDHGIMALTRNNEREIGRPRKIVRQALQGLQLPRSAPDLLHNILDVGERVLLFRLECFETRSREKASAKAP